jgi:2-dehydro-3-deoxyphosphogluconate aldolase/(4S)-4-hydroxy-2-oxoglutarate aldolase
MIPGTSTLGEMEQAIRMGLEVLKFFPAEANGGVGFLKNCAGPHKNLKWMCTGGISAKNVNEYLGFNQITAVGGTWMFKGKDGSDLIKTENWDEITRLCREAVNTMLGFEVRHVGMNCATREEAAETAQLFSKLFGFPYKPGNSSDFSGIGVECNHYPKLGKLGHIAIGTNSVERAIYQLEAMGVEFNYDEYVARDKKNPDIIKAIYLKKEFSGFAVHLVQK